MIYVKIGEIVHHSGANVHSGMSEPRSKRVVYFHSLSSEKQFHLEE